MPLLLIVGNYAALVAMALAFSGTQATAQTPEPTTQEPDYPVHQLQIITAMPSAQAAHAACGQVSYS